ncbi:hypothetical protein NDU88_006029 [Pleurodeles waltl]|uniref:Uncharacterized protein n=1 Tax=Pleurodeles waltl TaxID=8319 RepID=A0AAV7RQQ2_PLEWA|nr:hypothetical protein NDU88_006029 [Pleurodeles waltl]
MEYQPLEQEDPMLKGVLMVVRESRAALEHKIDLEVLYITQCRTNLIKLSKKLGVEEGMVRVHSSTNKSCQEEERNEKKILIGYPSVRKTQKAAPEEITFVRWELPNKQRVHQSNFLCKKTNNQKNQDREYNAILHATRTKGLSNLKAHNSIPAVQLSEDPLKK